MLSVYIRIISAPDSSLIKRTASACIIPNPLGHVYGGEIVGYGERVVTRSNL